MGFELYQQLLKLKLVLEFVEWMKYTLEEAKTTLWKSQDDMALYYNQHQIPAPFF